MTSVACLGCRGRGLTWANPSSLSTRPIDTSSRSTSKRSLMMRLRSTHRHRTTPSVAGSGARSTIRLSSCFCSHKSFGGGPGALPLMRPSGPLALNRCTQSRNVCRSIAPISAAASRLIPSRTAASDKRRLACPASCARFANSLRSPALQSVRNRTAAPIVPSRISLARAHGITRHTAGEAPA